MLSKAPSKYEGVEIKAVNIVEHLANAAAPLPAGAAARELIVNAQQAGASSVHFLVEQEGYKQGVFQKIVVDDGEGMDETTLRGSANLGFSRSRDRGDSRNRGTGAKNACLLDNPSGLVYISRRDGRTLLMVIQRTESGDAFIIRSFRTSDDPSFPDSTVIDIDDLDEDGTLYTVEGEVFTQQYTKEFDGESVLYTVVRNWRAVADGALGDRDSGTAVLMLGSEDNADTYMRSNRLDKYVFQKNISSRFLSISARDGGDFAIYCAVPKSYDGKTLVIEKDRRRIRPIGQWLERPHFSKSGSSVFESVDGLSTPVFEGLTASAKTYLVPIDDLKDGVDDEDPTGVGFDHLTFPFFALAFEFHPGIVEVLHVESPGAILGHPMEHLQKIVPSSTSVRNRLAIVIIPNSLPGCEIVAENEARTKIVVRVNGFSREFPLDEFCFSLKSRLPSHIQREINAGVRLKTLRSAGAQDIETFDTLFPGNVFSDVVIEDKNGRIAAAKKDGRYVEIEKPADSKGASGSTSRSGKGGSGRSVMRELAPEVTPDRSGGGKASAAIARAGLPDVRMDTETYSHISVDFTRASSSSPATVTIFFNSPLLNSAWAAVETWNMSGDSVWYSDLDDPNREACLSKFRVQVAKIAQSSVAGLARLLQDAETTRRSISSSNDFHDVENIDGLRSMLNDAYLLSAYVLGDRVTILKMYQREVGRSMKKKGGGAE